MFLLIITNVADWHIIIKTAWPKQAIIMGYILYGWCLLFPFTFILLVSFHV